MKNLFFLAIFICFVFARQDYTESINLDPNRMQTLYNEVKNDCENGKFARCQSLAKFYYDEKYAKSVNLKPNFKKSKELSKIACRKGDNAMACINLAFYSGEILEKQIYDKSLFKKGFDKLTQKCDDENALSCYQIAFWQNRCNTEYDCLDMVSKSEEKTEIYLQKFIKITKKSCKNGNKIECIKLINCYNGKLGICEKNKKNEAKKDEILNFMIYLKDDNK